MYQIFVKKKLFQKEHTSGKRSFIEMNVRIEINYIRHPKCCICRVYTNVLSDNIHMMFVSNAHIKVHKSRKEA